MLIPLKWRQRTDMAMVMAMDLHHTACLNFNLMRERLYVAVKTLELWSGILRMEIARLKTRVNSLLDQPSSKGLWKPIIGRVYQRGSSRFEHSKRGVGDVHDVLEACSDPSKKKYVIIYDSDLCHIFHFLCCSVIEVLTWYLKSSLECNPWRVRASCSAPILLFFTAAFVHNFFERH